VSLAPGLLAWACRRQQAWAWPVRVSSQGIQVSALLAQALNRASRALALPELAWILAPALASLVPGSLVEACYRQQAWASPARVSRGTGFRPGSEYQEQASLVAVLAVVVLLARVLVVPASGAVASEARGSEAAGSEVAGLVAAASVAAVSVAAVSAVPASVAMELPHRSTAQGLGRASCRTIHPRSGWSPPRLHCNQPRGCSPCSLAERNSYTGFRGSRRLGW
jgi:hypothetical protein